MLLSETGHVGEILMMSSDDGFSHTSLTKPCQIYQAPCKVDGRTKSLELQEQSHYNRLAKVTPCNRVAGKYDDIMQKVKTTENWCPEKTRPSSTGVGGCVCLYVCGGGGGVC